MISERKEFYTQEEVQYIIDGMIESPDIIEDVINNVDSNYDSYSLFELGLKNAIEHTQFIERWTKKREQLKLKQKQVIIDMMKADEKDGLYNEKEE